MAPAFVPALAARAALTARARTPAVCPRPASAPRGRVVMHGPGGPAAGGGGATTERRPGSAKGFVEEMRFVAMRLHTKDQAPSEGKMEESALPIDAWLPSHAEFLQFLVDSQAVYEYFENDLVAGDHPVFSRFKDTGLERSEALKTDIAYINSLGVPTPKPTAGAAKYVDYMRKLEEKKPEAVLCHWYNYYFAHSAGGRMIGRMMQQKLFDGREFAFYEWESDVKELLAPVRATIDDVASGWTREVKDDCIKETGLAFGFSGQILQNLAKAPAA